MSPTSLAREWWALGISFGMFLQPDVEQSGSFVAPAFRLLLLGNPLWTEGGDDVCTIEQCYQIHTNGVSVACEGVFEYTNPFVPVVFQGQQLFAPDLAENGTVFIRFKHKSVTKIESAKRVPRFLVIDGTFGP